MSRDAEDLLQAALALSEEERAELVVRMLDSIRGSTTEAEAHVLESLERLRAAQNDELALIDHDDAMRLIAG